MASGAELRRLMEDICSEIGFRHFALIHHDDLRKDKPGLININNYPPVWADYFIERRLYIEDPIVHACLRTNAGFSWSNLSDLIRLNGRHRTILEHAGREGLNEGITIPACVRGERSGSCSFGGPRDGTALERYMMIAQLVGAFGFAAARRLASGNELVVPQAPRLSPRQRECVILVGQGKSDWEIATILGLSPITVKHYLADARRVYDVPSRTQLVICAILDNEIGLSELAPWQYVHLVG
ncbi:LuxR family transcriptional regulator [Sphingobium estronivorans]|uniref:LuxR family transcriptional regulator n=1 Tax=Sphingobium estronivorans TaxID=1577690 RepID=UPI0013C329CD|nr:LuxR family transcriptional regulator [Sphingobium estronivorans]